jgi:hypothetical protein
VGTISNLNDWLSRKSQPDIPPVAVSAFGFTLGETLVTWQTVSEIWGYKVDRLTTDEAFLEFTAGGLSVSVSEEQPGHSSDGGSILRLPAPQWRRRC